MKVTMIRATVAVALVATASIPVALAQDGGTVPRTPGGRPDLQGNWTNGTITPIERPTGFEAVLTPGQVAEIEGGRQECIEAHSQLSDPGRDAPAATTSSTSIAATASRSSTASRAVPSS